MRVGITPLDCQVPSTPGTREDENPFPVSSPRHGMRSPISSTAYLSQSGFISPKAKNLSYEVNSLSKQKPTTQEVNKDKSSKDQRSSSKTRQRQAQWKVDLWQTETPLNEIRDSPLEETSQRPKRKPVIKDEGSLLSAPNQEAHRVVEPSFSQHVYSTGLQMNNMVDLSAARTLPGTSRMSTSGNDFTNYDYAFFNETLPPDQPIQYDGATLQFDEMSLQEDRPKSPLLSSRESITGLPNVSVRADSGMFFEETTKRQIVKPMTAEEVERSASILPRVMPDWVLLYYQCQEKLRQCMEEYDAYHQERHSRYQRKLLAREKWKERIQREHEAQKSSLTVDSLSKDLENVGPESHEEKVESMDVIDLKDTNDVVSGVEEDFEEDDSDALLVREQFFRRRFLVLLAPLQKVTLKLVEYHSKHRKDFAEERILLPVARHLQLTDYLSSTGDVIVDKPSNILGNTAREFFRRREENLAGLRKERKERIEQTKTLTSAIAWLQNDTDDTTIPVHSGALLWQDSVESGYQEEQLDNPEVKDEDETVRSLLDEEAVIYAAAEREVDTSKASLIYSRIVMGRFLQELAHGLDWLERSPCILWCGVHFAGNPILGPKSINNELAFVSTREYRELQVAYYNNLSSDPSRSLRPGLLLEMHEEARKRRAVAVLGNTTNDPWAIDRSMFDLLAAAAGHEEQKTLNSNQIDICSHIESGENSEAEIESDDGSDDETISTINEKIAPHLAKDLELHGPDFAAQKELTCYLAEICTEYFKPYEEEKDTLNDEIAARIKEVDQRMAERKALSDQMDKIHELRRIQEEIDNMWYHGDLESRGLAVLHVRRRRMFNAWKVTTALQQKATIVKQKNEHLIRVKMIRTFHQLYCTEWRGTMLAQVLRMRKLQTLFSKWRYKFAWYVRFNALRKRALNTHLRYVFQSWYSILDERRHIANVQAKRVKPYFGLRSLYFNKLIERLHFKSRAALERGSKISRDAFQKIRSLTSPHAVVEPILDNYSESTEEHSNNSIDDYHSEQRDQIILSQQQSPINFTPNVSASNLYPSDRRNSLTSPDPLVTPLRRLLHYPSERTAELTPQRNRSMMFDPSDLSTSIQMDLSIAQRIIYPTFRQAREWLDLWLNRICYKKWCKEAYLQNTIGSDYNYSGDSSSDMFRTTVDDP